MRSEEEVNRMIRVFEEVDKGYGLHFSHKDVCGSILKYLRWAKGEGVK